jgi:hypothetical protein
MFEQELEQLATAIRAVVRKHKESIKTLRRVRVRRQDLTLKYSGDPEVNFERERIEEDIWDIRDEEQFQNSVVKQMQEYKSIVSALGPKADSINGFTRAVSFASFHGLDDEELREHVKALGRELDNQPLPVKVTAYLSGLTIRESPLIISDDFILRLPTPEDMAEDVVMDEYGGFSFPQGHTYFSVVGDFFFNAISTGLAQREFLRTLDALRLFRVGGITVGRYLMRSRHSIGLGGTMILAEPQRFSRCAYALSSSDAAILNKFRCEIVPLLPDPFHLDVGVTEREIAYVRYRDALFQGPSERAITSAITALEALLLEDKPGLTHRLAQRVSVFLRVLGTQADPECTYDNVRKGYKIRNTFIHGGSLAKKDRPQADSLMPTLMAYARECLLASFQMQVAKAQLLSELDRAMIDPRGLSELEASFASVVHR